MFSVLGDFGFGNIGIRREDFLETGQVIQLGRPPNRIDILTSISGVTWEEAWDSRKQFELFGQQCFAIGLEPLLRNSKPLAAQRICGTWNGLNRKSIRAASKLGFLGRTERDVEFGIDRHLFFGEIAFQRQHVR